MSRAHLASLTAFLAFALVGIAGFFASDSAVAGLGVFLLAGLIGSIVASMIFKRLATPEEIRQDLEDRTRSGD